MTPAAFRAHLSKQIAEKGLRTLARELGVDHAWIKRIADEGREPSDEMLAKMGFRRTVKISYERI